jgi:hypothetical protein
MDLGVPVKKEKPWYGAIFSADIPCLVIKKVCRGSAQQHNGRSFSATMSGGRGRWAVGDDGLRRAMSLQAANGV